MNLIKELKPGTTVNINYKNALHQKVNTPMTYVGLIVNDYLILKFQSANSAMSDSHDLKAGVQVSVRSVVTQEYLTAINFVTESLGVSKLREPLLLLKYPTNVKGQNLRTTPRISVELMANITYIESKITYLALITDFSMTGLKCEYLPDEEGNNPAPETLKNIDVQVEFIANDDLDMDFVIRGNVKNIRQKEKVHLGMAFNEEDLAEVRSAFAILLMREYGL